MGRIQSAHGQDPSTRDANRRMAFSADYHLGTPGSLTLQQVSYLGPSKEVASSQTSLREGARERVLLGYEDEAHRGEVAA